MPRHIVRGRVVATALLIITAGCSSTTQVTGPTDGAFRLIRAQVSAPAAIEFLEVTAELTNTGTVPLRSGGCLRPDLAMDVQSFEGWTTIDVLQTSELVQCIQAFTLAPGASQQFTTAFRRGKTTDVFPRDTPLRLRVLLQPSGDGPTLPITLR